VQDNTATMVGAQAMDPTCNTNSSFDVMLRGIYMHVSCISE
jgi:hypothetical protein